MKKIVSMLLTFLTACSFAACGGNGNTGGLPNGNSSSGANNSTVIGGGESAKDSLNDGNHSTDIGDGEDLPNSYFKIVEAEEFSDGVATISVEEVETNQEGEKEKITVLGYYDFLINHIGEVLFDFADIGLKDDKLLPYHNGVAVYMEEKSYGISYPAAVYDKKGEVVISSDKQKYDNILAYSTDNRYFVVDRTEESFSGDTYMVGIIDNNGNYIQEMSADNLLAQQGQMAKEENTEFTIKYIEDDIFWFNVGRINYTSISNGYYHVNRDIITDNYNHIELTPMGELYEYGEAGNKKELYAEKEISCIFDNAVLVSEYDSDFNKKYQLFDYKGNILLDLTEYKVIKQGWETSSEKGFYYYNGYFLTQIENSTGGKYCCLFNADGELIFDPIRMEGRDHFYPLSKYGFIYKVVSEDKTETHWLYKYDGTKEILQYVPSDKYDEGSYSFENGPELIYVSGSDYQYFFINEQQEIVISGETIKR